MDYTIKRGEVYRENVVFIGKLLTKTVKSREREKEYAENPTVVVR